MVENPDLVIDPGGHHLERHIIEIEGQGKGKGPGHMIDSGGLDPEAGIGVQDPETGQDGPDTLREGDPGRGIDRQDPGPEIEDEGRGLVPDNPAPEMTATGDHPGVRGKSNRRNPGEDRDLETDTAHVLEVLINLVLVPEDRSPVLQKEESEGCLSIQN